MRCEDVQKRLLFYLDGELGDLERQAVEGHLPACPACRSELVALQETQRLLRRRFLGVASMTAPPQVWMGIQQSLASSKRPGIRLSIGGASPAFKWLVSWRPAWKLALPPTLAVLLVVSAILAVTRLVAPSPAAMAREIARDSPEIRALMEGEPAAQTVAISGDQAYVLNESISGESNLARVDLETRAVREVSRLPVPLLTEEDKAQVINIATSDPAVRQLLDTGAAISSVHLVTPVFKLGVTGGEPVVWNEGIVASVTLRGEDERWIARVITSDYRVADVSTVPEQSSPTFSAEVPQADRRDALLHAAMSDTTVSMIMKEGGQIVGVATGGRRANDKGAIILKLGEEMWSVTVDLSAGAVTRIWPVSSARYAKTFVFKPTP